MVVYCGGEGEEAVVVLVGLEGGGGGGGGWVEGEGGRCRVVVLLRWGRLIAYAG